MCLIWSWHVRSRQQLEDTVWVNCVVRLVYMIMDKSQNNFICQTAVKHRSSFHQNKTLYLLDIYLRSVKITVHQWRLLRGRLIIMPGTARMEYHQTHGSV